VHGSALYLWHFVSGWAAGLRACLRFACTADRDIAATAAGASQGPVRQVIYGLLASLGFQARGRCNQSRSLRLAAISSSFHAAHAAVLSTTPFMSYQHARVPQGPPLRAGWQGLLVSGSNSSQNRQNATSSKSSRMHQVAAPGPANFQTARPRWHSVPMACRNLSK
jgi:hypothetical protein